MYLKNPSSYHTKDYLGIVALCDILEQYKESTVYVPAIRSHMHGLCGIIDYTSSHYVIINHVTVLDIDLHYQKVSHFISVVGTYNVFRIMTFQRELCLPLQRLFVICF